MKNNNKFNKVILLIDGYLKKAQIKNPVVIPMVINQMIAHYSGFSYDKNPKPVLCELTFSH